MCYNCKAVATLILHFMSRYKVWKVFGKNKKIKTLLKCFCFSCLYGYLEDSSKEVQPPQDLYAFQVDLLSFHPLYRLIFLACSVSALGTNGYLYSVCLIYVFLRNNVLLVVLSAVSRSGE